MPISKAHQDAAEDSYFSSFGVHMNLRSLVVWCVFVVLAIMNGGFRNAVVAPRLGEFGGHIASTVLLCAAILAVTWLTIGWVRPVNSGDALLIGGWMGPDTVSL